MKKLLAILILAIGTISFSAKTQNIGNAKVEKTSKENIAQNSSFNTITLKLVGTRVSKTDKNKIELEYENCKVTGKDKKVFTEKDFQVNGKKTKIIISKTVSTKMMDNFINSDEEISIIGFLENNEGIRFKPFDFSFKVNKDEVKKIYFKDGTIYIWDN